MPCWFARAIEQNIPTILRGASSSPLLGPILANRMNEYDIVLQNENNFAEMKKEKGWQIQVTSTSTHVNSDGTFSSSSHGRTSSSSTSKSTRTIIENGRKVMIQSMEKDGNSIEERYEGNKLVQRLVNGLPQKIDRITGDDF